MCQRFDYFSDLAKYESCRASAGGLENKKPLQRTYKGIETGLPVHFFARCERRHRMGERDNPDGWRSLSWRDLQYPRDVHGCGRSYVYDNLVQIRVDNKNQRAADISTMSRGFFEVLNGGRLHPDYELALKAICCAHIRRAQ